MQSVVSYPHRGPYGQRSWRGNTSGHLLVDLFTHYRPGYVVDPAEGSGTTKDVCTEMKIAYTGLDLHSGFNLLRDPLSLVLGRQPDFIFYHPPYGEMVKYSGSVWGSEPHPDDLSQCKSTEEFLSKLEFSLLNIYDALQTGGKYAVLIGDHRRDGEYHSYQADIINMGIGKLRDLVVKIQHNCVSDRTIYQGKFIPIRHEYCLLFAKERGNANIGVLSVARTVKMSKRFYGTWRNVVEFAMRRLGGRASLRELYDFLGGIETANQHVNAKIRQTVQRYFTRVEHGVYAI